MLKMCHLQKPLHTTGFLNGERKQRKFVAEAHFEMASICNEPFRGCLWFQETIIAIHSGSLPWHQNRHDGSLAQWSKDPFLCLRLDQFLYAEQKLFDVSQSVGLRYLLCFSDKIINRGFFLDPEDTAKEPLAAGIKLAEWSRLAKTSRPFPNAVVGSNPVEVTAMSRPCINEAVISKPSSISLGK